MTHAEIVEIENKIREKALALFPVDPEYDNEPYEDGTPCVIDMNSKRRDEWIEIELEKALPENI